MFEFNTIHSALFGIPSYIFFAVSGIIFAMSLYPILLYKVKERVEIYIPRLLLSSIFLILGAKILGIIVSIFNAIQTGSNISLETITQSGIVFYGGLFGFLLSFYYISVFRDKHSPVGAMDSVAVIIPLFHSVTRIGCFTAGCCYGCELDTFISVLYTTQEYDRIITALRLPVQLIEALFNLVIFIILIVMFFCGIMKGKLIYVYLLLYSVVRFVLEFFRGDAVRGVYFGIST
ncbi:MAG: prolipoprotein diacylglyceryl transferase, partial [Acutalibacteraceae bacterium]